MITINFTKQFKRDYKRESSGLHAKKLKVLLENVTEILVKRNPFPERYYDHALSGEWVDHRDCHLKPDLVLIYRYLENDVIEFVRLGSHSELGL